ncbi:MAG: DUF5667 domain-containing protein [Candidatus Hydrothermarchaeales archaeon]
MKAVAITLCILMLTMAPVSAQEAGVDPGVTPDSFLYGLDVALDQISLLLTFDKGAKAKKGLEIAEERLLEVKEMAEENKLEAMKRAQEEHSDALDTVTSAVGDLERANSTEEMEDEIEIEKELEEHRTKIEMIRGELKVKIKVKGDVTAEQQAMIDSVLGSLENQTGKVKIEIDNKKGRTKTKIKIETGKSDEEIEDEVEEIERKKGLTEFRKERAEDQIEDAREEIAEVKEEILEKNITDIPALDPVLSEAGTKLEDAERLFAEGDYGATFGQATAAEHLAKNAKRLIEREIEALEEAEEEREIEIEVEMEDDQTTVEVEIDEEEMEFALDTTNRGEIVSEIASRTGLTPEEVEGIIKFKEKEERSRKQSFEIGNKSEEEVKKTRLKAVEEEEPEKPEEKEEEKPVPEVEEPVETEEPENESTDEA